MPVEVGSLRLTLSGPINQDRIENFEPYSLFANVDDDFFGEVLPPGNYTLMATPFSMANGMGQAGTPLTVNFTIVERAVTQFVLVNTDTDTEIGPIQDGDVIDLATLTTHHLNVVAITTPSVVGSVRLALSGATSNMRTENVAPYALFGDIGGNFLSGNFNLGNHTLTATPFAMTNATGQMGQPLTINFEVIYGAEVTQFILVDAVTDQDLRVLQDNDEIDLAQLPNGNQLNIRAETMPTPIGSVVFQLSGATMRTQIENNAIYALFANQGSDYLVGSFNEGLHTLTATPFSKMQGNGLGGTPLTIQFNVLTGEGNGGGMVSAPLVAYPVPFTSTLHVRLADTSPAHLALYGLDGKLHPISTVQAADVVTIRDAARLPQGVYFLRVTTANGQETLRVVRQ